VRSARALAAGLLVAASLPPWGWWPLALVGIAVFETALGGADSTDPPSRRTLFWRGWLFGLGWLAPGMAWMWFLTAPGYVVATALFAAFHGAAAALAPTGNWRVIGRPAAHTIAEALRMVIPFGGVPLATLGISQVAGPLAALGRVGGVLLITWATFQIGFALAGPAPTAPTRSRADRSLTAPHGVFALAAVLVILLVSFVAPQGNSTATTITVAAVQGGGPQGTRAIYTDDQVVIDRHIEASRRIPDDAGRTGDVDLVMWPENVIDVDGIPFEGSPAHDQVAAEAARIGAPFSVGITEDSGGDGFTNAQVIVTPDGDIVSRYDKVRRVPFGEYMPLRDILAAVGAPVELVPRDAVAGTQPAVLTAPIEGVGDVDMGVVISWEVFFGGRAREGVEAGGSFITNPTNGSSYTWTILQTQQVASSRLRAIETGRAVVQVSPTGFSAFVDPDGTVHDRTAVSEETVITRDLDLRDGLTWYVRLGEYPWVAAMFALFALSWAGATGRLRPLTDLRSRASLRSRSSR
jgi:apolipoprotein N-acyltransferase